MEAGKTNKSWLNAEKLAGQSEAMQMNIVAIGAHPDDLEIFTFGFLAEASARGDKLFLGVATDGACLLYTSPSPRDRSLSRMPSSA